MLSHITYLPIDFTLRSKEESNLPPSISSTIRGILGTTLRQNHCDNIERSCEECLKSEACLYTKIFYNFSKDEVGRYTIYPPPYIIHNKIPIQAPIKKGETITFTITLIGNACLHLKDVILNVKKGLTLGLGANRNKFTLESVQINNIYIYKDETLNTSIISPIHFSFFPTNPEKCQFNFDTPLKIKISKQVQDTLDFPILFENIYRRISTISKVYCNKELNQSFNTSEIKLIEDKMHWEKRERYSNRKNEKMSLGGLVGSITFQGELSEFIPFIELGKILHIGKNCSMGLGHYDVFYY